MFYKNFCKTKICDFDGSKSLKNTLQKIKNYILSKFLLYFIDMNKQMLENLVCKRDFL